MTSIVESMLSVKPDLWSDREVVKKIVKDRLNFEKLKDAQRLDIETSFEDPKPESKPVKRRYLFKSEAE